MIGTPLSDAGPPRKTGKRPLVGLDMIQTTKAENASSCWVGAVGRSRRIGCPIYWPFKVYADAQTARLVLCAASPGSAGLPGSCPAIGVAEQRHIEAVRLRWVASLLCGQVHLDREGNIDAQCRPATKRQHSHDKPVPTGETTLRSRFANLKLSGRCTLKSHACG